ncbi:MAG: DNA-directed RNA polymerase subunit H [Candidatus Helarchaeota archaeon]
MIKELIKNVKNLLKERGFENIKSEESSDKGKIIIRAEYNPSKSSKPESVMVYVWDPEESVGVQDAREIVKIFKNTKIKRRFLVGGSKFTRMARMHLEENKVEYIPTELVMLNVLEHELVPKHRILDKEEAEKLLSKLKIDKSQLPSILVNDPVAKIIGAREGDIIEIIRESKTAGTSIAYRHVIRNIEGI